MTLSPIVLTLAAFLLAAIGALLGGGIAWGRLVTERKTDREKIDTQDEKITALEEKIDKLTTMVAAMTTQLAVLTDRSDRPPTGRHAAVSER